MGQLEQRVVAITGATSGIGRATARELASAGANVVLGGRRRDRLAELERELEPGALAVEMNVRVPADCGRLVAAAVERFGRLDALVVREG